MSRFASYEGGKGNNIAMAQLDERIKRLEQQVEYLVPSLNTTFVKGRLNTTRPTPANSADVNSFDQLYDIVRDTDYEYILIDNGGTLTWYRIAMSTF